MVVAASLSLGRGADRARHLPGVRGEPGYHGRRSQRRAAPCSPGGAPRAVTQRLRRARGPGRRPGDPRSARRPRRGLPRPAPHRVDRMPGLGLPVSPFSVCDAAQHARTRDRHRNDRLHRLSDGAAAPRRHGNRRHRLERARRPQHRSRPLAVQPVRSDAEPALRVRSDHRRQRGCAESPPGRAARGCCLPRGRPVCDRRDREPLPPRRAGRLWSRAQLPSAHTGSPAATNPSKTVQRRAGSLQRGDAERFRRCRITEGGDVSGTSGVAHDRRVVSTTARAAR